MKKIGLVTTHRAINYGGVLQAYALYEALNQLPDVECQLIDYMPDDESYGRELPLKFRSIKDIAYSLLLMFNFKYKSNHKKKVTYFDKFLKKNVDLTKKKYLSKFDFDDELLKFQTLICGSDQIWNLNLIDDPVFFLKFDQKFEDLRKVSYAPSITEKMSGEQVEKIKLRTNDFSKISMREKKSSEVYTKLLNKTVHFVLDPIFLIDINEWKKIARKPDFINEKPFLLTYGLVSDPILKRATEYIKNELDLIHVDIQVRPYNKYNANYCTNKLSPENYIWLFLNADYICTSSFHGTAFSIHFNKQFITAPSRNRSLRIENILQIAGLKNRQIQNKNDIYENSLSNINYEPVNNRLRKEIKNSLDYLLSSI